MKERRTRIQAEAQLEEGSDTLHDSIPIPRRPVRVSVKRRPVGTRRSAPRDPLPSNRREVQGVYIISVAARLLEMHPQTLRKYERLGLVSPVRTVGMLRLYSERDLKKLRLIRYLETDMGMNLAGVRFVLDLLEHVMKLHERLAMYENHRAMQVLMDREVNRLFREMNLPPSLWR